MQILLVLDGRIAADELFILTARCRLVWFSSINLPPLRFVSRVLGGPGSPPSPPELSSGGHYLPSGYPPPAVPVLYRPNDPPLRSRSLAGRDRRLRRGFAAQLARSCATRRAARLHALLGRRASQPALGRELGARDHDRPDRGRDETHAHRLRRRDAAEPCAADGGGALQGAGGAVSRPHRSRARARARHRSGHVFCTPAPAG